MLLSDPPSNQVAVKLKSWVSINTILARYNATQVDVLTETNLYALQLPAGQTAEQILPAMKADTDLWSAEPNYYTETAPDGTTIGFHGTTIGFHGTTIGFHGTGGLTPTPVGGADQWAWLKVGLANAHKISMGQNVIVAVLDTGMVGDHSLSQSNIIGGYDFVRMTSGFLDSGNSLDDNGDGLVDDFVGHGTHVSGIILTTTGAPYNMQIMPIRVLNSDGIGTYADVAKGIRYAVDQKVINHLNVRVINMSLTAPRLTPEMADALAYAAANGVLVVSAAGVGAGPNYPADYSNPLSVIGVGATDQNDAIASFSGGLPSDTDVFAPGVDIYSSFPYNGFALGSGTSMAAPIVAGEAAMLIAKHPDWSMAEISQRIISKGATVSGSSAKRVDLAAALSTGIEVDSGALDTSASATDALISPRLRLSNNTSTDIPLTEIKLRYWYTVDGVKPQAFGCDFASTFNCQGTSNIGATFTAIPSGNVNLTSLSDTYAEMGFISGAGNLGSGVSLEMFLRIYKTDSSLYNELNDYSYLDPTKPVMTRWDRITVYRNGVLVWGIEPTASTILTSTPTRTPTLYVPTATYTRTATGVPATATQTKTKTPTAAPSVTKTSTPAASTATKTSTSAASTATRTSTPVLPTATSTGGGAVKVQIEKDPSGSDTSSGVGYYALIFNTGTTTVSNVTTRVYFTLDGSYTVSQYVLEKYYDQCGSTIQSPTLVSGSTYYFTVNCGGATLAPGASWQINFCLHLMDWSANLNSTNDWWHTTGALPTSYTDWAHIPAYINGARVWGVEPP